MISIIEMTLNTSLSGIFILCSKLRMFLRRRLLNVKYMNANTKKNAIYSLVLVLFLVGTWWYRQSKEKVEEVVAFYGETMGTNYTVKYLHEERANYQTGVDSLLKLFNQSLSTYLSASEISRFNEGTILKYETPFFYPVLQRSYEIYDITNGAFDPTVAPLVNAWGFGPDSTRAPSQATIDSLLTFVSFDSLFFDSISVCKLKKGIKLDFSAIAKGYGVDVVAAYLKEKGIDDMMVEIGGEVMCYGKNADGESWKIGIDNPNSTAGRQLKAIVALSDQALATSGNYRNYYIKDGKKYSHTISPVSGKPVEHTLLSASVFAPDCMTADAYATAFMVLGLEPSLAILKQEKELDAYLVYSDENGEVKTVMTEGIKGNITEKTL